MCPSSISILTREEIKDILQKLYEISNFDPLISKEKLLGMFSTYSNPRNVIDYLLVNGYIEYYISKYTDENGKIHFVEKYLINRDSVEDGLKKLNNNFEVKSLRELIEKLFHL